MAEAIADADARELLTLGDIAKRLNVSAHRVKYAIETYRIEPVTRVGIIRCWGASDLVRIKQALLRIAGNRGGQL